MKTVSSWNWWMRMLICSLIAGFFVPYLAEGFGRAFTARQFFFEYAQAFCYSICIGGILSPFSPPVWRLSDKLSPFAQPSSIWNS
jgi:hypothetical protein